MKQELKRIQKLHNLNHVYIAGDQHPINKGYHTYVVERCEPALPAREEQCTVINVIQFQNGPRNELDSKPGLLDTDLLEIVRHRLKSFQEGPYATRENALMLTHVEEALLWANKRVMDRAEDEKLGTNKV